MRKSLMNKKRRSNVTRPQKVNESSQRSSNYCNRGRFVVDCFGSRGSRVSTMWRQLLPFSVDIGSVVHLHNQLPY